jgi:hypothetical protein
VPACRAQDGLYVGFDQNLYPGDAQLSLLHKNLSYVGYWLNNPPGETSNPWKGKRAVVTENGFGFLILFNGRLDAAFKRLDPVATGRSDAAKAIAAATSEGFPPHAIIFLDIEEGGRMLPRTAKYVAAWVNALRHSNYRSGAYCAGDETEDDPGTKISTADEISRCSPLAGQRSVPACARLHHLDERYAHGPVRPQRCFGVAVLPVSASSRTHSSLLRHLREGRQLLCPWLAQGRKVLAGPGYFQLTRSVRRQISNKVTDAATC